MEIPTTSYGEWVALNRNEISASYREYVRDALEDSGFDITMLEDFYTWSHEEYECLTRYQKCINCGSEELTADVPSVQCLNCGGTLVTKLHI